MPGSTPAGCIVVRHRSRSIISVWESMEIRVPRAHENVGSNPTSLTGKHCGGVRAGTGRRLLIVTTQVRFLSPQLDEWQSSGGMRSLPRKQVSRKSGLWVRVPRLPPEKKQVPLAERQRRQPSKLDRRVRFPQGTLDWVGSSAAEQVFVKHPRVGSSPTLPSFIAG